MKSVFKATVKNCFFIGFLILSVFSLVSCMSKYDFALQYITYDHISYEGEDYFYLDSDEKVLENYIAFSEKRVNVKIVDENGNPLDPNRTEEAYTYVNDDDLVYIYFNSAVFTKDISKAALWNTAKD